jgi:hypothetical protein
MVLVPLLLSCDGNYRDVVINGRVIDSLSRQPVVGSEVNVVCWVYDTDIWESRKVVKDTLTDASGNFTMLFEKGEAIDVEVHHPDYQIYSYALTLDRCNVKIAAEMRRPE